MPWFKVDDNFIVSDKVIAIPRSDRLTAIGLWTYSGNYSARLLTNGHIPIHMLEDIDAPQEMIAHLIRVGLWDVDAEGKYWFHNWNDYQPSAEAYLEKQAALKAKRSEDGRIGAAKRWSKTKSGSPNGSPNGSPIGSPNAQTLAGYSPEPEPDPEPKDIDRGRGKRIPEDFQVSDSLRNWFDNEHLTVDMNKETAKFVDHYLGVSGDKGLKRDWDATWRSWMRRAQEYRPANADVDPWAGKVHLGFAD